MKNTCGNSPYTRSEHTKFSPLYRQRGGGVMCIQSLTFREKFCKVSLLAPACLLHFGTSSVCKYVNYNCFNDYVKFCIRYLK